MQYQRPNGGGAVTGSLSLALTVISTFFHLAPPGQGFLSSTIFLKRHMPYHEAEEWVQAHARTAEGRPLRSFADWNAWLHSPQGKHRPSGLSSAPHIDYHSTLSSLHGNGNRLGTGCARLLMP